MNNLFKELGPALKPEKPITITANVRGKKIQHSFLAGTSKNAIQLFLIDVYKDDCWSWE